MEERKSNTKTSSVTGCNQASAYRKDHKKGALAKVAAHGDDSQSYESEREKIWVSILCSVEGCFNITPYSLDYDPKLDPEVNLYNAALDDFIRDPEQERQSGFEEDNPFVVEHDVEDDGMYERVKKPCQSCLEEQQEEEGLSETYQEGHAIDT